MSLLAWTGQLPDNWEAKPLRSAADYVVSNVDKVPDDDEIPVRLCNYTDVYNNEFITLALDFMQATASEAEISRFGVAVDDVIITKDSESWDDIGVPALVRETADDLVCGYHLARLRPLKKKMNGAFLFRCLQAKPVRVQLELAANGVTRFGIPKSEIGTMRLPVPPLPQQRAIADYLDRETARLDALVAAKKRVLGLLSEKRHALITRAVTRGLDPHVPLRDSGIPWLGKIPAHWEIKRLKHISPCITVGVVVNPSSYVAPEGVPFLYGSDITEEGINTVSARRVPLDVSRNDLTKTCLKTSDIVTVRVGAPGVTAVVPPELDGANCASIMLTRGAPSFDSSWLAYAMNSSVGRHQVALVQYGAAQEQFNIGHAATFSFAVPPLTEQRDTVSHLHSTIGSVNALRTTTTQTIELLKERRAALIAAAVTGQLEVA